MGNIIGSLTQGELVQVLGRVVSKIGENMHAGMYSDGVQVSEYFELVQQFAKDAYEEYVDED